MPLTVLRSHLIDPSPVKAHEIMETACCPIESVIQKSGVGRRLGLNARRIVPELLQHQQQHQRPRVVIDTISFREIRNGKTRVLKNSSRVAHPEEVIKF